MEDEKRIVKISSCGIGTFYDDVYFIDRTSFKSVISNVLCLTFLCLSIGSCSLDLDTVSTNKPVSFPILVYNRQLT